ncbi:hypothetical protein C8J57DRAFT_1278466 [Mycena rebaudengoi]|nr:hypothetical protein C8J57DRAFT_1278466 [Mycena rebaudengoi]
MSSGFNDVSEDVLFEITKRLDCDGLLNFLSTCRLMRELLSQRTIWLDALVRIKESDIPRPVHTRTLSFASTGHWTSFISIPGTSLTVHHSRGSVSCWDILTSECVAYLDVLDLRVKTETLCMEIQRKALIGACIGEDVISSTVTNTSAFRSRFFFNSHLMGFCTYSSIISWSMDASIEIQDKPHEFSSLAGFSMQYLPFGPMLYGFHKGLIVADAALQRISFLPASSSNHDVSPEDTSHPLPTISLLITYPFAPSQSELCRLGRIRHMYFSAPCLFAPDYGVFAVTCRTLKWEGRRRSVVHYFSPTPTPHTTFRRLNTGRCFSMNL